MSGFLFNTNVVSERTADFDDLDVDVNDPWEET